MGLNQNEISGSIPVELENARALQLISLQDNQLSGAVPDGLTKLQSLAALTLDLNDLTSVPDFASHYSNFYNFQALSYSVNRLPFEELEKNISLEDEPGFQLYYADQKPLSLTQVEVISAEESLALNANTSSANNTYQWFKNGEMLSNENQQFYQIDNADISDIGTYHCEITNSVIPNVTLNSGEIAVHVVANVGGHRIWS